MIYTTASSHVQYLMPGSVAGGDGFEEAALRTIGEWSVTPHVLTHGTIICVYTSMDDPFSTLTEDGIDEL